jgi:hypothetical protein
MNKRIILQTLLTIAFVSPLSAATQTSGSISSAIATIESKSGKDKADILANVAKANIEHLISKTDRKIRSLELRQEKYSKKLTLCQNQQKLDLLLCKIQSVEDRLKSYRELDKSLNQMKTALSQKTKN